MKRRLLRRMEIKMKTNLLLLMVMIKITLLMLLGVTKVQNYLLDLRVAM